MGNLSADQKTLTGRFTYRDQVGTFEVTLDSSGDFAGTRGGTNAGAWTGNRINSAEPPLNNFGTLVGSPQPAAAHIGKTWDSSFGELTLVTRGNAIAGLYGSVGIIFGVADGDRVRGNFTNGNRLGKFDRGVGSAGFSGNWAWEGESSWSRQKWTSGKPPERTIAYAPAAPSPFPTIEPVEDNPDEPVEPANNQNPEPVEKPGIGEFKVTLDRIYVRGNSALLGGRKAAGKIGLRFYEQSSGSNTPIPFLGGGSANDNDPAYTIWDSAVEIANGRSVTISGYGERGFEGSFEAPLTPKRSRTWRIDRAKFADPKKSYVFNFQTNLKSEGTYAIGWKQQNYDPTTMKVGQKKLISIRKDHQDAEPDDVGGYYYWVEFYVERVK